MAIFKKSLLTLGLADSSPFKALASIENTKLALEDKNHEWDF